MREIKTTSLILLIVIPLLFTSIEIFAQNKNESISDFYQYANEEWINKTILPDNFVVINQAGILWDKIENKSLEILSGNLTYGLDEEHLYALKQLRNFYQSTSKTNSIDKKRISEVQKNFPMIFGIVFSEITITQQKEVMIKEVIKYLTSAYRYKIENTSLIGDNYKEFFLNKLDHLKIEIGAPPLSQFPKIPALSNTSYSDNLNLAKLYQAETEKIQTDWRTPYETDCFYYPGSNKINIYAGTLLDFDHEDDVAYLYATLGRTIAHEMTHAYDMTGGKYDMDGEKIHLAKKVFSGTIFNYDNRNEIYDRLIHQFNDYSYHDSLFVDGEKTLQENFADLGGVEISILALKMYLDDNNFSKKEINDSLRKYFLCYARFWKEKGTAEFEIASFNRIHTPQKFRAIGPIYNQNEFYQLYNINTESEYYIPESKRITIW